MPDSLFILNANLITQEHLRAVTLPSSIASCRQHKAAGRVNVHRRDYASTMTRDDGEGNGLVAGFGLFEVIDSENIERGTVNTVSCCHSASLESVLTRRDVSCLASL